MRLCRRADAKVVGRRRKMSKLLMSKWTFVRRCDGCVTLTLTLSSMSDSVISADERAEKRPAWSGTAKFEVGRLRRTGCYVVDGPIIQSIELLPSTESTTSKRRSDLTQSSRRMHAIWRISPAVEHGSAKYTKMLLSPVSKLLRNPCGLEHGTSDNWQDHGTMRSATISRDFLPVF